MAFYPCHFLCIRLNKKRKKTPILILSLLFLPDVDAKGTFYSLASIARRWLARWLPWRAPPAPSPRTPSLLPPRRRHWCWWCLSRALPARSLSSHAPPALSPSQALVLVVLVAHTARPPERSSVLVALAAGWWWCLLLLLVLNRRPIPPRQAESTGTGAPVLYVVNIFFKCFRCFRGML